MVEPALAGSDVPLPEDGFTHEVTGYNFRATYLMLFLFRLMVLINADFFLAHVIMVLFFRKPLDAAIEALIDIVS